MKAYLGVAVVGMEVFAVVTCQPSPDAFREWSYTSIFAGAFLLSPVCGFFFAIPFRCLMVGPFYHFQARRNGAPFQPGDRVRVLAGAHCGRVTRVYSLWQGNTVRVELGKKEEAEFKDIFSPTQLLRETT